MYEELALQQLSLVSAASRLKVAQLLCPITYAPEAVLKALANDHDQNIGDYVSSNFKSHSASQLRASHLEQSQSDLVRHFLESAPISSNLDLAASLTGPSASEDAVETLAQNEIQELVRRGLKYGHTSMIDQLAQACGLTADQVHQCCAHASPDGFIVLLVGLGVPARFVDQLLVRFWGTLIDLNSMRDLQQSAAGIDRKVAGQLIRHWSKTAVQASYRSVFERTETATRDLKTQGASLTRPTHNHAELATLKA
ncbi:hypothetical protein GCM10007094_04450 [Pseudovibrio japonicus]|uniref:DUF2336 domain-containing protein n=2 Tax=Pseudovibrio japonicus TaxID=366534 RepID=A0ABQ3E081_9HYPH|nr:hypothetical protein GCM10007094_04450 [Pseudovibrio japonicus]